MPWRINSSAAAAEAKRATQSCRVQAQADGGKAANLRFVMIEAPS